MKRAYIALGTNIEPRLDHLKEAIEALYKCDQLEVQTESSIYETAPVGYVDQAHFLNMVLEVKTSLAPLELLDFCQSIEAKLGRERTIRFGPRTIDLDILVYNEEKINNERLTVPHPRMHERAFVLVPLAEIAEDLVMLEGKSVRQYIDALPDSAIEEVVKWSEES